VTTSERREKENKFKKNKKGTSRIIGQQGEKRRPNKGEPRAKAGLGESKKQRRLYSGERRRQPTKLRLEEGIELVLMVLLSNED